MLLFVKSKKAFTAIELAVVIVIMAILAVAASVQSIGYDTMKLDAAARKVASDIRYAQNLAFNTPQSSNFNSVYISFSAATETYQVFYEDAAGATFPVKDPFTKENLSVDLKTGPYKGVTINSVCFGAGCCTDLGFGSLYSFGSPDTKPYLVRPNPVVYSIIAVCPSFSSTGTVVLGYQGKTRTVRVQPETGLVQIQ